MKKTLCAIILLAGISQLQAQDTARYFYAILNVDRVGEYANVEYSNGFQEDIWKKLNLKMKLSRHEIIFRCFEYLNEQHYEFTGGESSTGGTAPVQTSEYIFKRKRFD